MNDVCVQVWSVEGTRGGGGGGGAGQDVLDWYYVLHYGMAGSGDTAGRGQGRVCAAFHV